MDGGSGNDLIEGSPGDDRLVGGPGNDGITGMHGDDRLIGGPGSDNVAVEGARRLSGRAVAGLREAHLTQR